ncbi:hypothetical protein C8Q76DRAFT_695708 [Earliella scabrosa]|nr:hypothetical protein C8Q76DRAFT_695708 [Earliella scabrosa]
MSPGPPAGSPRKQPPVRASSPSPRVSQDKRGGHEPWKTAAASIGSACTTATQNTQYYECAASRWNDYDPQHQTNPTQVSLWMEKSHIQPTLATSHLLDPPQSQFGSGSVSPQSPDYTSESEAETARGTISSSHTRSRFRSTTTTVPTTIQHPTNQSGDPTPDSTSSNDAPGSSTIRYSGGTVPASSAMPHSTSPSTASLPFSSISSGPQFTSQTTPRVASSATKSSLGAIVGGVVGGLAFIILAAATFAFIMRRRRRAAGPAPSAEFMHMARSTDSPAYGAKGGMMAPTQTGEHFVSLARQRTVEDYEPPPAFTPGGYRDRVLEKVQESAAMRDLQ